jgi:hypothetical protein
VLDVAERMEKIETTIPLGATADIGGGKYEVIGVMERADDENTYWTEYLLYNPRSGFLWLVETDEGWFRTKVQDEWPEWRGGDTAKIGNQTFKKVYDYPATVVSAAGAFNWRVKGGDKVHVTEFESGKNSLAAEMTDEELTWSLSTPVGADQIRAWFGNDIEADKMPDKTDIMTIAQYFLYGILAFNIIPLMVDFDATWGYAAFAALAVWLPAKFISLMLS